jgi:hypothetical protein
MATGDDVRKLALSLPRTEEHLVRDRPKFRIRSIVYLALSADETTMGFGYPKEERAALVAAEPAKFQLPRASDLRFNWVHGTLALIDQDELHELVVDAWRMCVPKFLARAYLDSGRPYTATPTVRPRSTSASARPARPTA